MLTLKNFNAVIPPKTYTIVWNETSNPSEFFVEYQDDAVGLTQGSTAFDDFFGYSAVLLNLQGNEVEEVTQSSPGVLDMNSFHGSLKQNNVMIKFPRRGIKMSKSGTQVTLSITDEPNKSGFQYYAFTKGTTAKDYLYLGAYKSTFSDNDITVASSFTSGKTYMKSWATGTKTLNFSPCANQTIVDMRSAASKYGNGYSMITIYPRWYINCLYMMKYGNPDARSVVGAGYTGGSASAAPGGTNSQTSATYGTSSGTQQVKLFGLEDWWGNIFEYVDGGYFDSRNNLTVDKTNNVFQDSAYSTNLGVALAGYIAGIDGSNDGMFRNISTSGGSGTTYYTDFSGCNASKNLCVGGSWSAGNTSGVFYTAPISNTSKDFYYGARLQFL